VYWRLQQDQRCRTLATVGLILVRHNRWRAQYCRGAHPPTVFGYHVTWSTGTMFLFGIVVGAVALLEPIVLVAGTPSLARRRHDARTAPAPHRLPELQTHTNVSQRELCVTVAKLWPRRGHRRHAGGVSTKVWMSWLHRGDPAQAPHAGASGCPMLLRAIARPVSSVATANKALRVCALTCIDLS